MLNLVSLPDLYGFVTCAILTKVGLWGSSAITTRMVTVRGASLRKSLGPGVRARAPATWSSDITIPLCRKQRSVLVAHTVKRRTPYLKNRISSRQTFLYLNFLPWITKTLWQSPVPFKKKHVPEWKKTSTNRLAINQTVLHCWNLFCGRLLIWVGVSWFKKCLLWITRFSGGPSEHGAPDPLQSTLRPSWSTSGTSDCKAIFLAPFGTWINRFKML